MRRRTRIGCTSHLGLTPGVFTKFLQASRQPLADALGIVVVFVVVIRGHGRIQFAGIFGWETPGGG